MGASASIHSIYAESGKWFMQYFDSDMYRKDFESIDKDGDGGISYSELVRWFRQKNEHEGGSWKVFLANPEVIQYAHVQSSRVYRSHDPHVQHKVIGIDDFRTFLIHFFAISVLWIHFKNADDCQFTDDFGNMKLSFDEFKLAVNTLTATREREECGDEQLKKDFATLDIDNSGNLGFAEVCAHCCKYIDAEYAPNLGALRQQSIVPSSILALQSQERPELHNLQTAQAYADAASENREISAAVLADLAEKSDIKAASQFMPVQARNALAVEALSDELKKEVATAEFEQIKFVNSKEMNDLLQSLQSD